jgi:phenylalanyl-tRNA synthetase alpha chain
MTDVAALVESLHPHEMKVLTSLTAVPANAQTERELARATELGVSQTTAAIGRLQLKNLVKLASEITREVVSLTEVGKNRDYQAQPLIAKIPALVAENRAAGVSTSMKDLQEKLRLTPGDLSGMIGLLKSEDVIRIVPGGVIEPTGKVSATAELLSGLLARLNDVEAIDLSDFTESERVVIDKFSQKRGKAAEPFRIHADNIRRFESTDLGRKAAEEIAQRGASEEVAQLTPQMLKDGNWRNVRFRKYTIALRPERKSIGKKHPYREFLDVVKAKFVGMGFEEMRGSLVENEFWDMDALYMPQFHPARDIHDVYFVKTPSHSAPIQEPFLKQVKETHERGWKTGSSGWGYAFDPMRTRRLVLRSQGTAVSSRTLAAKPKAPGKYFSIARCFRYDQVDATHAADFYQIEGIVLGPDINFRTLLGLLKLFGEEIAQAQELRFLPAYFPFTEPSVELHVRHPRLGWMELGGAGLFRPEVTRPLGVDVPVIAWGLGLDRMAMVALEIHDIRDLFSPDLEMIRSKRAQY